MPPPARNKTAYEIKYDTDASRRGERYNLAIELAPSQVRVAALATGTKPVLSPEDPFRRTGFYSVGRHAWEFEPVRGDMGRYEIAPQDIETVAGVVKEFTRDLDIRPTIVDRIRVGVIITFDDEGWAVPVHSGSLRTRLHRIDFPGANIVRANQMRPAIQAERDHGAGLEIRPSDRMIYVTINRNLILDAPGNWSADGIFARGISHSPVDRAQLEQLGTELIGGSYTAPPPRECRICKMDCLHSIASGQGILELFADEAAGLVANSKPADIVRSRLESQRGFTDDRGAQAVVDGVPIDSAAVFEALKLDPTCRRLVLQAGIAIGVTIADTMIRPGLLEPDVVVVGGTVDPGDKDEDQRPLNQRDNIDSIMQATLLHLLPAGRLGGVRVTRSRFAGFTDLLGLAVARDEGA